MLYNVGEKDGKKIMKSSIDVFNVADWVLTKESMTPKKLQKMVYYAYAWFLTFFNESEDDLSNRLFNEHFEAWVHGPVCPELYRKYKDHGWQEIPKIKGTVPFNEDVNDIFEQVWDVYGSYTAGQLESISHQEEPWQKARDGCPAYEPCNNIIDDKEIFKCYSSRLG